ncbi:unnamed protein product [Rotaria socialis]
MNDSKVDLVCTERKGRCWITNQAVSQGEILFVWKPYIIVPYVTNKDYVCANCIHICKEIAHIKDMIGCRQDCRHVFYCSDECEQQHWDKFHQYECPFLDKIFALHDLNFNDDVINYARLVMRMLTQRLLEVLHKPHDMSIKDIWTSRSHFDKFSIEKKKEFEVVAKILTEYILTRLIPDKIKDIHDFIDFTQSFLPDTADVEKVEINDFEFWFTEMAHFCLLLNDATTIEVTKCLLIKVYILICMEEINALFHITFALEGYTQAPQTYAMGMYPLAAFVNHSCSPNLARFPVQEDRENVRVGDVVFFATRSLKKGEELCYSYLEREYELYRKEQVSANEIVEAQAKREQRLKEEFFFDCDCTRCFNETKGNLDTSYVTLIKELKCTKSECKGWLIPSFEKYMRCEACGTSS